MTRAPLIMRGDVSSPSVGHCCVKTGSRAHRAGMPNRCASPPFRAASATQRLNRYRGNLLGSEGESQGDFGQRQWEDLVLKDHCVCKFRHQGACSRDPRILSNSEQVRDFDLLPIFDADFSKLPFQSGGSSSSSATVPSTGPTQASRSVKGGYVYQALGAAPSAGSSL